MKRVALRLMVMEDGQAAGRSLVQEVKIPADVAIDSLEAYEAYIRPAIQKLARGEA